MEVSHPSNNDGTAAQHLTAPKPSTFCLFMLAFLKLVLSLGLLLTLTYTVLMCFIFGRPQLLYVIVLYITIFFDVIDIIIGLVLIISICMKYQEIMEMYYTYSIYMSGCITVLCCLAYFILVGGIGFMFILFCSSLLFLLIQVCLNYKMKNEVLKLRTDAPVPL